MPGLVDEAGGVAVASVNLGWRDLMLRDRLEELVGAKLGREAGCHGAALGAWLALGRTRDELAA